MNTPTTGKIRPKSDKTTTPIPTQTTGLDAIRFDYSHCGTLSLGGGATPLASLLSLGAFTKTRQRNERFEPVMATDGAGCELVSNQLDDTLDSVLRGIGIVGKLLALSQDPDSQTCSKDMIEAGWLICGLAELAKDLHYERGEIDFVRLNQCKLGG